MARVGVRTAIGLAGIAVLGASAWSLAESGSAAGSSMPAGFDPIDFGRDVRPILASSCLACHGFDPSTREAGLRLDTFDGATAAPKRGGAAAIVPGDAGASALIERVTSLDPAHRMPFEGEPLTAGQIGTLRRWIDEGARYERHWSLEPVSDPSPPEVNEPEWSASPIDRFVRARQIGAGLDAPGEADRRTLIRRLGFDLVGLPPTPEEVEAFECDVSPDATARVVDRLLASPRFGERWARHWLDLVRYAETYAHEFDYPIRHAWRYRDYVIRAFNADVPYDTFVLEHIAGDLLDEPRRHPTEGYNESIIGTGFWWLSQGTHGPVDVRLDEAERIDNQIDVMSKAFLATTVSCARCHDHKFDPIYTSEYYGIAGVLQSSRRQEAYLDPGGRIDAAINELRRVQAEALGSLADPDESPLENHALGINRLLLATSDVLFGTPAEGERAPEPVVLGAFDGPDYGSWAARGDAFADAPERVGPDRLRSENTGEGVGFAGSHRRREGEASAAADARTGSLTSRSFTIENDWLHFLIGGGRHPGKTGISLVVDGEVVASATGHDSLRFRRDRFATAEHIGSTAHVEIFDDAKSGWGNISVDSVIASDDPSLRWPRARDVDPVAAEHGVDPVELARWVAAFQENAGDDSGEPARAWLDLARTVGGKHNADVTLAPPPDTIGGSPLFEFEPGPVPAGWFASGWAFGDGITKGGTLGFRAARPFVAERTAAESGALGVAPVGTLRSPTFEVTGPTLAALVKGRGVLRVIIDGYTMDEYNALLFEEMRAEIDSDSWTWHTHDVSRYRGHRAHYEVIDDRRDGSIALASLHWAETEPAGAGFGLGLEDPSLTLGDAALYLGYAVWSALRGESDGGAGARLANWLLEHGLLAVPESDERMRLLAESLPDPVRVTAMQDGTGEDERVFIRGNHTTLGEVAPRGFLSALSADPDLAIAAGSGRLEFAHAMLDPSNPMPARVMVNRVWQHLMGRGLVSTPDDFGLLGGEPSHPLLLDWLASRFAREMGWSVKSLIREIVLSRAYRSAGGPRDESSRLADPTNTLLGVREPKKLDGESIRDAILAVSGRLDPTPFGPSVPVHLTEFMTGRGRPAASGPIDGDGRRSVYLEVRRNFLTPMMQVFDTPTPHSTMGKRADSNVPAQSLTLLNDPFVQQQARLLAERVRSEALDPRDRLDRVYGLALGRAATDEEAAAAFAFLDRQTQLRLDAEGDASPESASTEDSGRADAWADLCHVVLNLKEFRYIE